MSIVPLIITRDKMHTIIIIIPLLQMEKNGVLEQ